MKNKKINEGILNYFKAILSIALVALISSCSTDDVDYGQYTAQQIYDIAEKRYADKDYEYAAEAYASIDKNYPYSPLSAIGLLKGAIAYYEDGKYVDALDLLDKYLILNMNSPDAPQAMYIQASCYIAQMKIIQRDQFETKEALSVIKRMEKLYPDNQYTKELLQVVPRLRNQLAGKIMENGKEELRINNFSAAINNFQEVLETYGDTVMVPEALYRLIETYTSMELYKFREKIMNKLKKEYANNEWTKRAERLIKNNPEKAENLKKIEYINGEKVSEIQIFAPTKDENGNEIQKDPIVINYKDGEEVNSDNKNKSAQDSKDVKKDEKAEIKNQSVNTKDNKKENTDNNEQIKDTEKEKSNKVQ